VDSSLCERRVERKAKIIHVEPWHSKELHYKLSSLPIRVKGDLSLFPPFLLLCEVKTPHEWFYITSYLRFQSENQKVVKGNLYLFPGNLPLFPPLFIGLCEDSTWMSHISLPIRIRVVKGDKPLFPPFFRTKIFLASSGCRTRPLKTGGYQPRLTQNGYKWEMHVSS